MFQATPLEITEWRSYCRFRWEKKILTNLRWISTRYDKGFFFRGWGQGFFKSESYVKPSARTPAQGQQLMQETKAAYSVQDGNSCSANKWCSTRGELHWSHKLLHRQKSESSFMCLMLAPGWEGVGRHSWYLHRGFSDQCWLVKGVHLLESFKKAEKQKRKKKTAHLMKC